MNNFWSLYSSVSKFMSWKKTRYLKTSPYSQEVLFCWFKEDELVILGVQNTDSGFCYQFRWKIILHCNKCQILSIASTEPHNDKQSVSFHSAIIATITQHCPHHCTLCTHWQTTPTRLTVWRWQWRRLLLPFECSLCVSGNTMFFECLDIIFSH